MAVPLLELPAPRCTLPAPRAELPAPGAELLAPQVELPFPRAALPGGGGALVPRAVLEAELATTQARLSWQELAAEEAAGIAAADRFLAAAAAASSARRQAAADGDCAALTDDYYVQRYDLAAYSLELTELRARSARAEELAKEGAHQLTTARLALVSLSGARGDLTVVLERTAREVGDVTSQLGEERRRSQVAVQLSRDLRAELDRRLAAAPDPPPQPLPGTGLPPHSP